ncbi:MAG: ABC-2 family transporter protein [Candidatus Cloacimonetes bacterium]|nr:ABC-2 family transporter protein [Candidatus Cloacimonadota bacterium]
MSSYYIGLGKQTLKQAMVYRTNFILSFLVILIPLTGELLLAKFVYANGYQIGTWQLNNLILYYISATVVSEFFAIGTWWDIGNDIKYGGLNYHLIRPYSYFWHNFVSYYVLKLVYIVFAIIVAYIAMVIFSGNFIPNIYPLSLLQFAILALIAAPLAFLITFFLSILAFFFTDIDFISKMLGILLPFISGNILPLDIFPATIQKVLIKLPSAYLVYYPSCILVGNYGWKEFFSLIIEVLLWLIFFWILTSILWFRGRKIYEAIG